jgi:hypothetical protein
MLKMAQFQEKKNPYVICLQLQTFILFFFLERSISFAKMMSQKVDL